MVLIKTRLLKMTYTKHRFIKYFLIYRIFITMYNLETCFMETIIFVVFSSPIVHLKLKDSNVFV